MANAFRKIAAIGSAALGKKEKAVFYKAMLRSGGFCIYR